MDICFQCGGNGYFNKTSDVCCTECNGRGSAFEYKQPFNNNKDYFSPPGYVVCQSCGGRKTKAKTVWTECDQCDASKPKLFAFDSDSSDSFGSYDSINSYEKPNQSYRVVSLVFGCLIWGLILFGAWSFFKPTSSSFTTKSTTSAGVSNVAKSNPSYTKWVGKYSCRQGLTNVELNLNMRNSQKVHGEFIFEYLGANPPVNGSFKLSGFLRNGELILNGDSWIRQPKDWFMLNLRLNLIENQDGSRRLKGRVIGDGCSEIEVSEKRL